MVSAVKLLTEQIASRLRLTQHNTVSECSSVSAAFLCIGEGNLSEDEYFRVHNEITLLPQDRFVFWIKTGEILLTVEILLHCTQSFRGAIARK